MRNHLWAVAASLSLFAACATEELGTHVAEATVVEDPIAFVGHGALFAADGTIVTPDVENIFAIQALYRRTLEGHVDATLAAQSRALASELAGLGEDERAFLDAALVRGLGERSTHPDARSYIAKSLTLHGAYRALRPTASDSYPTIEARLRTAGLDDVPAATDATAASYEQDCFAAGVPIPPPWAQWDTPLQHGWIGNGQLPSAKAFIPSGLISVYYFTSDSPRGTCMALPRSSASSNVIDALGVICHGVDTSKACFWDNKNVGWSTPVPISQFVKGNTPQIANGGQCTNCHVGENPFVIHPNTALDLTFKVPSSQWSAKNWYDPLIHASLPQNPGPTNAIMSPPTGTSQGSCDACHRLPEMFTSAASCWLLDLATGGPKKTMPPSNPNNLSFSNHISALKVRCESPVTGRCSPDNAKICAQAGGYCEQAFSSTDRHDLCRWPKATTASSCASTAGIWTAKTSGFALQWPTAVPGNVTGACITQMRNIGGRKSTQAACTAANHELCRRRGGFCEDASRIGGGNHQLCRWPNHNTATKCASTSGIWTAATSGFSLEWPTAVRDNEAGSCITQMANIGGTPN
jgi:hypothetical protein